MLEIYVVRHAQAAGNVVNQERDHIPGYAAMKTYVLAAFADSQIEQKIYAGDWPAPEMRCIAQTVRELLAQELGDRIEAAQPLSAQGWEQAYALGQHLQATLPEIDLIIHSPY